MSRLCYAEMDGLQLVTAVSNEAASLQCCSAAGLQGNISQAINSFL